MGQIKNILLLLLAILICLLLFPIGFIIGILFSNWNEYLFSICISLDQLGNVVCSRLFDAILIKNNGYKFGNEDETISSVLGKNKLINKLSIFGIILDKLLDTIEKNHTIKSIENGNKS
jgi:hypothetical protein